MKIYKNIKESLYYSFTDIFTELGYPEIDIGFANENTLEPGQGYCVLNILELYQTGLTSEATYLEYETEELYYTVFYKLCIQASFIGDGSADAAFDFNLSSFNNRKCIESFQKKNLSPLSKSHLRRIPQLRDTTWIDCFNVDLDFTFSVQARQVMNWVEFITINGSSIVIKVPSIEFREVDSGRIRTTEDGELREVLIF